MKTFRLILLVLSCSSCFSVAYCQVVGKAVGAGAKTAVKAGVRSAIKAEAKTAAKSVVKQEVKQGVKAAAKQSAKDAAKKALVAETKSASKSFAKKSALEVAEKTVVTSAVKKEIAVGAEKSIAKQSVQNGVKKESAMLAEKTAQNEFKQGTFSSLRNSSKAPKPFKPQETYIKEIYGKPMVEGSSATIKKVSNKSLAAKKTTRETSAELIEKSVAKKTTQNAVAKQTDILTKEITSDISTFSRATSKNEKAYCLYKIRYNLDKLPPEQGELLKGKMSKELRTKVEKVKIELPKNNGHWTGERGNSMWIPDDDYCPPNKSYSNVNNKKWSQIKKENNFEGIVYKDGVPDLSNFSKTTMSIDWEKELGPDFKKIMLSSKNREKLQDKAFEIYAKNHNMSVLEARVFKGDKAPVEQLMKKWNCSEQEVWNRCGNPGRKTYVWHENTDCKTLDLIPTEIHGNLSHTGGISIMKNVIMDY